MIKNGNIARITTEEKYFFTRWLELTSQFNNLTQQEIDIIGQLLYHRHRISKDTSNETIIWKMVFDYDTKIQIMDTLNIDKESTLANVFSRLRKKRIIVGNKINKNYIPTLEKDAKGYKLIYDIVFIDEKEA